MFDSLDRTNFKLTWKELMSLLDFCTNVNILKKRVRCDKEIMDLINVIYNFKFYGINDLKNDQIFSSVFAKKYLDILSGISNNKQTDKSPKVHLMCKSDTLIAPFYNLLGLIPKQSMYLDAMKYNITLLNLSDRPSFLDNFITEISEKNNQYYVRLIRNGEAQMISTCGDYECKLEDFIKNTSKNILSESNVKKQCDVSVSQRLLRTIDVRQEVAKKTTQYSQLSDSLA